MNTVYQLLDIAGPGQLPIIRSLSLTNKHTTQHSNILQFSRKKKNIGYSSPTPSPNKQLTAKTGFEGDIFTMFRRPEFSEVSYTGCFQKGGLK